MGYSACKDPLRRTASNKGLYHKGFAITSDLKYGRYQHGLASVICKFFDKKSYDTTSHKGNFWGSAIVQWITQA